ncbi:hypothetical protein JCM13591A_20350 [Microbacterium xylanilyticum]
MEQGTAPCGYVVVMDDDELEIVAGVDEQTKFDAIIEAAVEHTRVENAALERNDTAAADEAHERRDAILPTDPFELRDLLDTAIEYLAIEQEENDDLRDAMITGASAVLDRRERILDRFFQGSAVGGGIVTFVILATMVMR